MTTKEKAAKKKAVKKAVKKKAAKKKAMKPAEIIKIKRRIIASIAEELGGPTASASFGKYAKGPDYSLYGKNNFISDAPKPKGK